MAKQPYNKRFKSGYYGEETIGEAVKPSRTNFTIEVKETLQDVNSYPVLAVPFHGITQEGADYFGIRSSLSETDGKTITATYFPYYNQAGDLVAYKKRDWTKPKEENGHFSVVGNLRVNCMLFGQQAIGERSTKKVYVTEGEGDAVALWSALVEQTKGTKYEGKLFPSVTSIPLGTANAVESIAHNEKFIKSYHDIVLAFDADSCTPKEKKNNVLKGKEATEAVAGYLLSDNIYTIEYPAGCKDSRQCIMEGYIKDLGRIATFSLQKYSPETVCSGDDVTMDDLMRPLKEGFHVERFPKLMDKIHGFRENELTTYAAFSGVGKSTLSREIAWELIRSGKKVGLIFLEEPMIKTQQSLIALELGIRLPEFRKDPSAVTTPEAVAEAKAKVLSNGNVYFLNHFGSLKVEKLMQQIKFMHFICGCTQIFIDHISMVVAGSESANERKDIDMLYEELASFMTSNPVGIHAVMHLKRVEDNDPNQKLKEGEEPKPYWRTVKKEMLRGSAGCVDKDTEFFSQYGWKKISDYEEGDTVLQYREDGVAELVDPLAYIKLEEDYLTHVKGHRGLDMVLCDDHRVVFATERRKQSLNVLPFRDVLAAHNQQSTGFRGLFHTTFKTNGNETLGITEDQLRLQIAVNADGWVIRESTGMVCINIKKPRKIERLETLLEKTKTHYNKIAAKDGEFFQYYFKSPTKTKGITQDWFNLKQEYLEIVAEEVDHWDGEFGGHRFLTVNKIEADFIQFAYTAAGIRASISEKEAGENLFPANNGTGEYKLYKTKKQYRVTGAGNKFISMRKAPNADVSVEPYKTLDGFKYCFTLPSGMWVARRNGKIFITGNCEQMSSQIIVLENEVLPDGRRGRVRTKVEKNREWSELGVCDTMMQNAQGRLEVTPTDPDWIFEYYNKTEFDRMSQPAQQQQSVNFTEVQVEDDSDDCPFS